MLKFCSTLLGIAEPAFIIFLILFGGGMGALVPIEDAREMLSSEGIVWLGSYDLYVFLPFVCGEGVAGAPVPP